MKRQQLLKSTLCLLMALVCNVAWAQTPVLNLTADEIGDYPYELPEEDAAKVFALTDLTVAVRVNTAALSGRRALFCTSDPGEGKNTDAMPTNSHYVAYGTNGDAVGYLASCRGGDRYTSGSIPANTNDVVLVYVLNPTNNNFKAYINDSKPMDRNFGTYEIATPKMVREDFPNAKIYIGGGVKNDDDNFEVFNGTITGVKVYDGVLTAEQIATVFTELDEPKEFRNGDVYTFITDRGWMGATENGSKVISTARTSVDDADKTPGNANFQWTVYKSNNGNYYLYNLGKQQFMGVQTANNAEIDFVATPAGRELTFKQSSSADYPIMFSTDNAGVVNHSTNHGGGLINWTGGWNKLNDGGSNHQVTLVATMEAEALANLSALVEAYDKRLAVKVEVTGLEENNPNTHFGNVIVTSTNGSLSTKLKTVNIDEVACIDYDGTQETAIDFTREYRGFEFQGYFLGEENLGKSFTLTGEQKDAISEENPLVAKFEATDEVTLFYDDDEFSYRIPAIATTSTGRLIAVSDYRHSLDDIGSDKHVMGTMRIDLVARTSDDNGKTWSEKKTIAQGDNSLTGQYGRAFGDAAIATVDQNIVVMAAAGDVMYPYASAENPNRMARIFSSDNGESWSVEEMTTKLYSTEASLIPSAVAAFFGSGKLAVDPDYNGTGEARIYGALLARIASSNDNNFAVYSDDLGKTWSILGGDNQTPIASGDEPKIEILPNGQILLSARRGGGRIFNVFTYTDKTTNAGSWNGAVNGCNNGGSNATNGEIFLAEGKKSDGTEVTLLLQSQPKGGSGQYDRKDVTIWYKEVSADETYTSGLIAGDWIEGLQMSTQLSSYSTMSLQEDGKVAFFFEEAPCYDDNYAKGYSMVYVPLTIENITKGNYFSKDADLDQTRTINVVLTDAQENTYTDQLIECKLSEIATKLTEKYPYITLDDNAGFSLTDGTYTYTNTVTLPFKVSNETTTVWHNIYFPSNGKDTGYPVYMSAETDNDVVKIATESAEYGNSTLNTLVNADKISWAFYQDGKGFTFKLKNKLNSQYVKTTSTATSSNGGENVKYTDNINEAAAFSITDGSSNSYRGDYALTSNGGYLMVWSVNDGRVTYSTNTSHQGAWAKITEAPDYEALIASIDEPLASDKYGDGLGQYKPTGETNLEAIREAMQNSSTVKLNTLNSYKGLLDAATLNMPVAGQFFRIRGISGNYIDATSIYNNANATTGQMSMKSAEECDYNGTVFYLDEEKHLLNYATCTYVKQTREIGVVGDTQKGTWTFAESPNTAGNGKYALSCTTTGGNGTNLHDSDGNRADRCGSNCGTRHDFTLEEVTSLPVTISSIGYATLYAPVALAIPEGVAAYVGTLSEENDETVLTLEEVENVIPAETGVVLYRPEGTDATNHRFDIVEGEFEAVETAFVGDKETVANSGNPYTLQKHNGGVAFKQYTGTNISGFKAYLNLTETNAARAVRIRFAGEETSIDNSELIIQDSPLIYDLMGRRVENPTKGVYVVNGKKVVVK